MKNTKVTLVPLTADDREQFILDNQWAFKFGAIEEFGKRDEHDLLRHRFRALCYGRVDADAHRHRSPLRHRQRLR